jgi:hypothetical protein
MMTGEKLYSTEAKLCSEQQTKGVSMKIFSRASVLFIFAMTLATIHFWGPEASAQSSYFTSRGCVNCHVAPTVATCAGCHQHSGTIAATTNKTTSYAPGETVTVTMTSSGARSGWIGARLYNQSGVEIARATGSQSGMGGSTVYPAVLSAPAPATAGTYTWKIAYFGNNNGTGTGDVHSEKSVNVSFTVAAAPAADTTAPVVSFTLPATSTSLTVAASFSATDNVGVTGYQITKSATAPAATATGWLVAAPTSVTAVAGSNTFYAWAKDAAGNVSLAKSATVTVTLPPPADTAAPVVSFTLPATSTSLTVAASFSATDNVGVTGYQITKSATAPAATATGWLAAAPTSVTAVAGSNTFYAWAKDAAGNVSLAKSATVTVTLPPAADTTKPTLTISALANGTQTNKVTLNISGSASDAGGLQSVTVNGQAVIVNADGSFSTALTLVAGANTITVIATDKAGNQTTDSRTVTYDANAPVLAITAPADNSTTAQSFITLTGTISETSTVSFSVNGGSPQSAAITGGTYSATAYLVAGVNTISITATDLAGNIATAKRTVTYSGSTSSLGLAVTNPSQDITTRYPYLVLRGKVTDNDEHVTVKITMNGRTYTPAVDDGEFRQRLVFTTPKLYAITISATDAAGNSSSIIRNVIYRPGTSRDDD